MSLDILVVDDEQDIRELVAGVLQDEGYEIRAAADSDAALEAIATRRPSLVLLDVWLQGSRLDGLELLEEIKRRDASIPVLVISGHGNLDTAVAAIRRGAVDFIEKPFKADRLLLMVGARPKPNNCARKSRRCALRLGRDTDLTGTSSRDQRGAGDAQARRRHRQPRADHGRRRGRQGSRRAAAPRLEPARQGPFIVVSAARMIPERVEEELFGVEEAGDLVRTGLLEQAHGGTCSSTRSPTCRSRPRRGSCAS